MLEVGEGEKLYYDKVDFNCSLKKEMPINFNGHLLYQYSFPVANFWPLASQLQVYHGSAPLNMQWIIDV